MYLLYLLYRTPWWNKRRALCSGKMDQKKTMKGENDETERREAEYLRRYFNLSVQTQDYKRTVCCVVNTSFLFPCVPRRTLFSSYVHRTQQQKRRTTRSQCATATHSQHPIADQYNYEHQEQREIIYIEICTCTCKPFSNNIRHVIRRKKEDSSFLCAK